MVKLNDLQDYESLPMTKWKIKQPSVDDDRENAMDTGKCHDDNMYSLFCIMYLIFCSSIGFNLNAWSSFY